MKNNIICGIYKIISPTNKIYIGQSINIKRRFSEYKSPNGSTKYQVRIYRSLIKYGVKNHKFEIIEKCDIENLNERERYYQDLYKVLGRNGLNCVLQEANTKRRIWSQEAKLKISNTHKNKIVTNIIKQKLSISQIGIHNSMHGMIGLKSPVSKLVINLENGIFHESIYEASITYNINYITLSAYLKGNRINKTNLILV